jgi:hypothetical protein
MQFIARDEMTKTKTSCHSLSQRVQKTDTMTICVRFFFIFSVVSFTWTFLLAWLSFHFTFVRIKVIKVNTYYPYMSFGSIFFLFVLCSSLFSSPSSFVAFYSHRQLLLMLLLVFNPCTNGVRWLTGIGQCGCIIRWSDEPSRELFLR